MTNWTDKNWTHRFEIIYKCRLSALYHRKRERFFALCEKITTAISLIAGAGAMTDLLDTVTLKAYAGAVVVLFTMPSIVFSWGDKSRSHALLASKFISLESEIEGGGILGDFKLNKFHEIVLRLDMEEPPQLSLLTRICQNEISYSSGQFEKITQIHWLKKKFAHFFDFPV